MTSLFALTFALALAGHQNPAAFVAGDKIRCFDDVSSESSTIKVTQTSPLAAYVRIEGRDGSRFYPADAVTTSYGDFAVNLDMRSAQGAVETISLSPHIRLGQGEGTYAGHGDSRALDCEILAKGSEDPAQVAWLQLTDLWSAATRDFVVNPDAFAGKVGAALLQIGKDARMTKSYDKVINAVAAAGETAEEQGWLLDSVGLDAYTDGLKVYVWLSGNADTRGDSTYNVRVEYDLGTKAITLWSDLEYVDHP